MSMAIMTIMTRLRIIPVSNVQRKSAKSAEWTVASAKAKFSELLERAQLQGPQTIARHGRAAAVVISATDWNRKHARSGNLADFFAQSPLHGAGLKPRRRMKDVPRAVRF